MRYEDFDFKIPVQCLDYEECSDFVVNSIEKIIQIGNFANCLTKNI